MESAEGLESHCRPKARPTMNCPICKKPVPLDDPNMPFCSDRCRVLDLGNWASEKYVISAPRKGNDLEELEETDDFEGPEGRPQ